MGSALAAGLLWILAFGTANAILVRGSVDPAFGANTGGINADLYWTADLEFIVDNACVFDGTHLCNVSGVTLTGSLSDATPPPPDVPIDTNFNYLENGYPIPTQFLLTFSGGFVTSIGTGPLGFHTVTNPLLGPTGPVNFWVEFVNGNSIELEVPPSANLLANPCGFSGSFAAQSFTTFDTPIACRDPSGAIRSAPAEVTITQVDVPEPGSLLLLAGALLAIGWMRRQQHARR